MNTMPSGFKPLVLDDPVFNGLAPIYFRLEKGWRLVMGFHIEAQHCNGRGNCHGGVWATLADVLMGLSVGSVTGLSGPTISLGLHYLAPAAKGDWVEGRAEIQGFTDETGFAECTFQVGGEPVVHASGIFTRRFPPHVAIAGLIGKE